MESNDKEAVDDGFESYEDSEDFEDAGQVFFIFFFKNYPDLSSHSSLVAYLAQVI